MSIKPKFSLCVLELPSGFKINLYETHELLLKNKFLELAPSHDFGCGWTHPEDLFQSNFSAEDITTADSTVVGGFRFDKKSVPGALVKKLFKEKLKEREKELGSKLDKADKVVLKEECKELLILKALPNPKMVQWVWNKLDNKIYLDAKSEKLVDEFIGLFIKTFDVEIQRKNYGIDEEDVTLFLDWVWQQSPSTEGQWVDKGLTLDADSNTFKFNGPTLEAYLKEIEALKQGKKVKEICIGCVLGNNDYYITFTSKNLIVTVENINKIKYESMEAAVLDRVDVCMKVLEKIETLIKNYLE